MSDIFAQQESVARRRKLLDAITQQNMQARIVGGHGIGQLLAKLGTAWVTKSAQQDVDRDQSQNNKAYGEQLSSELEKFMTRREGKPGETLLDQGATDLMQGNVNLQLAEPVQADPKRAVFQAMASRFPEMQDVGKAGLKEMLTKGARDPNTIKEVNGQLIDLTTGRVIGDYRTKDEWSEPYSMDLDGKMMKVRRNLQTGKVEAIGQGGTTVNVDTKGETEAAKALGKKLPELFEGARTNVIKAQEQMQSADRIMELLKNPAVVTGFGADPLAGLASIGAQLGITGPDAAAQTQALISELASQTLSQVKRLPGAITEKERPFLADAAAGRIQFTPEALQHIAGISRAVAHNEIMNAYQQFEGAKGTPGGEDLAKAYPLPPHGSYQLDPKLYEEMGADRFRYKGQLPGTSNAAPSKSKPIPLSEWVKQQAQKQRGAR